MNNKKIDAQVKSGRLIPIIQTFRGLKFLVGFRRKAGSRKEHKVLKVPPKYVFPGGIDWKYLATHPEDVEHAQQFEAKFVKKLHEAQEKQGTGLGTVGKSEVVLENQTEEIIQQYEVEDDA